MKEEKVSEKSTPKWTRWLGLLAVLLCTAYALWTTTKGAYDGAPANTLRYEWVEEKIGMSSDARILLRSVEGKSFTEMQRYWSQEWTDSKNGGSSFLRPLSIITMWAIYQVCGENLAAFLSTLALLHVGATLVLWRFLCYLFRSELMGTLAISCFALGTANHLFGLATPAYALQDWYDLVEPLLLIPYAGCLWAFIKYLRSGGRWLYASYALFVVAVCAKEAAYTLPLMCVALLWHERRLEAWRTILPFGVIGICGLLYRTWALQGMGTKFGSNGSWMQRAFVELGGGLPASLLNGRDALPVATGAALLAVILLIAKRRRAAAIASVLGVVLCGLAAYWNQGMDDPFYYQLLGSSRAFTAGFYIMLWMALIYQISTVPKREQLFGLVWVAITYSVLLAAPTTLHTLYVPSVGFAIIIGAAIQKLYEAARYAMPLHTSSAKSASPATTALDSLSAS